MSVNGIEWTPGVVCVFDGLQTVLERVLHWYEQRLESKRAGEALREQNHPSPHLTDPEKPSVSASLNTQSTALPEGIKLFEAAPIVDRKSTFIGRACRISDPAQASRCRGFHLIT
jgi:hypothetical protein